MYDDTEAASDVPASIDACAVDLDGTLTVGDGLTPAAKELLVAAQGAFVVLSNNSSHTPVQLSAELAARGLVVPAERIVLAGAQSVRLIAMEQPGARVMLFGSPALERLALEAGLVLTHDRPHLVVLARDERFSYEGIGHAANALRRGGRLVVANADFTHPGPEGSVVPETGALLAAVRACAPDVPYRVISKPEPFLFEEALRVLGTRAERTLMIGDNAATDGLGARRAGMPYLHVRNCDVTFAAALVRGRIRRA